MKIYLKSCSLYEVRKAADYGLIDGVSLLSNEAEDKCIATDSDSKSIANCFSGPVFIPVKGESAEEMIDNCRQAMRLSPNVVVKIKASLEGFKACKLLSSKNVSVSLYGFSCISNAVIGAKSGADYISFDLLKVREKVKDVCGFLDEARKLFDSYGFQAELAADKLNTKTDLEMVTRTGIHAIQISYKKLIEMISKNLD